MRNLKTKSIDLKWLPPAEEWDFRSVTEVECPVACHWEYERENPSQRGDAKILPAQLSASSPGFISAALDDLDERAAKNSDGNFFAIAIASSAQNVGVFQVDASEGSRSKNS
jgi:hypothetical protein